MHLSMKSLVLTTLCLLMLVTIVLGNSAAKNDKEEDKHKTAAEAEHEDEGKMYCETQRKIRNNEPVKRHDGTTVKRDCPEFVETNLNFFLSLFVIIAMGAGVRTFLRMTKLSIPYTVVLMMLGLLIGYGSRIPWEMKGFKEVWDNSDNKYNNTLTFCSFWSGYTKLARMPPKVILYAFLPVLIFDSAFNMKVHVFMKSSWQILVVALPGMVITTFLTAVICLRLMSSYEWNFSQASLYGSIISATDPVAVVAILRELGASDTLGTMIEGESLLNDGVAILLFEIFEEIVKKPAQTSSEIVKDVTTKFIKIALGGPALGFCIGKIAVFWLSYIFNDAAVEITITLVSAYLTYYLGETLGVSGVVAVVVLGIVMNKDSTSISPEVEGLVHHFWEMLGYLANTVLFVMVGVVITETAINQIDKKDVFHLIFLYISLNIVRFVMVGCLMPWLCRIGYGLKWKDMIVIVWGGLRGAVGLCLSLQVYREPELCKVGSHAKTDILGPKFLFHTAGIVILTLLVNGTTTKGLLGALKLTEISVGKLQDMAQAVRGIKGAQIRALAALKQDRFLSDSNWEIVEHCTNIHDPYAKLRKDKEGLTGKLHRNLNKRIAEEQEVDDEPADQFEEEQDRASEWKGTEPDFDEYRELMEEARQKLLEALKVSFYRQFEEGVLTEMAYHILVGVVNTTADKELHMIHSRDFKKYWHIRGVFPWIRINIIKKLGLDSSSQLPPKPKAKWRLSCWWLTTREFFDPIIHAIVILNLIPVIWETVLLVMSQDAKDGPKIKQDYELHYATQFLIVNCQFTAIYIVEFVLKMIGHGCKTYFSSRWNYLDLTVLIVSIADIIIIMTTDESRSGGSALKILVLIFRVGRITRSLRLLRPLLPKFYAFIDGKINQELFLGYDVGKGFVNAINDVLRYLTQMAENPKVCQKLKLALEHERLETVLAIGKLHFVHARTAIGVKTRHASRAVLNAMRDDLSELKEDGLLDENESNLLVQLIEEKMKRLWKTPTSLNPLTPSELLGNITWILGNDVLAEYMEKKATIVDFKKGEYIFMEGDGPKGIYLVISGMVKSYHRPSPKAIEDQVTKGMVPNLEAYFDTTFDSEEIDFLTTGAVLGELGVVSKSNTNGSIQCVTNVVALHIKIEDMDEAMARFKVKHDSLEARIWRSYGLRIGAALCPAQPAYQFWTSEKIRSLLERTTVPVGPEFDELNIPEFVEDVILIYGQVKDGQTNDVHTAPCFLPHVCSKVVQDPSALGVTGRLLIIANEEVEDEDNTSFHSAEDVVASPEEPSAAPEKPKKDV